MQTNLELTNLLNECLKHPVNNDFKGNFETFTSILFSGDVEIDDKVYAREEFLGVKPDTDIVHMLYCTMEDAIIKKDSQEFERLCYCHDKIDFHWDDDAFFLNILTQYNQEILDIMLKNGFEINDKCVVHYLKSPKPYPKTIETLALNYQLQNDLAGPALKSKSIKI